MSENMSEPTKTYFALALDPVHVGTGGSRLGRVDLPIIREPGTNLPKIPATSLSGCARAYTALSEKKYACAGSGGAGGEKHCGSVNPACSVCVPYGFSKGTKSMQGLAQFFDAHIYLFPVASMVGPVWVTSPMALEGLGLAKGDYKVDNDKFYPLGKLGEELKDKNSLNFGWLMLGKGNGNGSLEVKEFPKEIEYLKDKAVLVSNKLFSSIVNSNLEVRTSVSIDPQTGAAEDTALFIYEALPRGTVFRFEVVYNSGESFKIGGNELKYKDKKDNNAEKKIDVKWVKEQVESGLKLFETLGVGGMNTRGMGRLKMLNLEGGK